MSTHVEIPRQSEFEFVMDRLLHLKAKPKHRDGYVHLTLYFLDGEDYISIIENLGGVYEVIQRTPGRRTLRITVPEGNVAQLYRTWIVLEA